MNPVPSNLPSLTTEQELYDIIKLQKDYLGKMEPSNNILPFITIFCQRDPAKSSREVIYVAIDSDFNNEESKYGIMIELGHKLIAEKTFPLIVALTCEAWMVKTDINDPTNIKPSQHPDKEEICTIQVLSIDGKTKALFAPIDRQNGKIAIGHFEELSGKPQMNLLSTIFKTFSHLYLSQFVKNFTNSTLPRGDLN